MRRFTLFGLGLLLGLVLLGCGKVPSGAALLPGSAPDARQRVPDVTLTDQRGEPFRLADQRGRVLVLFFGYTHCPDVCPGTLATWKQAATELGSARGAVRFALVTVDPERDTPERLGQHVAHFDPHFLGLTGSSEALHALYRFFGVQHEPPPAGAHEHDTTGYLVGHTALVFVVGPQGTIQERLAWDSPVGETVAAVRRHLP